MKETGLTGYLFASEMSKALKSAQPDFTAAGLALSERPTVKEFMEKLSRL
jgi:hypothetical protein